MRRREFIALVGGAAAGWPVPGHAQRADKPVIGFLHSGSAAQNAERLTAFRNGLGAGGFVEGQNVTIEFRWADGHSDKLPAMAADLIERHVAVIATPLSTPAAVAAKAATATIPIVFTIASDPVALGLVASLNRPGGNATGITSLNSDLAAKRLGLLRILVPQASHFFALISPDDALARPFLKDLETAAAAVGIHFDMLKRAPRPKLTQPLPTFRSRLAMRCWSAPIRFFISAAIRSLRWQRFMLCQRAMIIGTMSGPVD